MSGEWSELHPSAVLRPKVCAANCWPAMPPADLTLPPSLLRQCAAFVDFYGAKHPRRALLWRLELGRAELRVRFSAQNERAVSATTVQMLALLAFNGGRGAVSFEEMRSRAAAPAALLRWHLSFLCAGPSPVLRRVACPEAACPLVGAEFYSLNPDYGGTAEAHEGPVVAAAVRFPPFFREHFDLFSDESFFSSQVQDKIRENDKNAKIRENALLFSDLFSVEEVNKMRRRKKQGEKMRSLQKPKAHSDNSESDGEDEAIALRSGRRVAAGGLRSSSEESSSDRANGREMAIDAAVVRILKREGPKSDAELFAAVKGELRRSSAVRVTMDEIAARVRDLAAKEFVRFDQERGVVSFLP